jgi:hypothetical protein
MVDGVPTPLKNMSSSVWMMIPNIWKHKIHVPNHQPDIHGLYGWFIIHNHNPYFIPYIIHTNGMKTWVRLMDKLNHGSYVSGMHIQVCASWIPCLRLYDLHGYQPRSTYFHRTDCMGLSESFRHTQVPLLYPIKCPNCGWFTPSFLLQKSPNWLLYLLVI